MIQVKKRNKKTLGSIYYYNNNGTFIEFLREGVTGFYTDLSVNLDIAGRAILYKEDKKLNTKYYDYDTNSWKDTVVSLPCYTLLSDGTLKRAYTTGVSGQTSTPNGFEVPYSYNNVVLNGDNAITVTETDSLDGKYKNVRFSGAYSKSYYKNPSGKWSSSDISEYKASYLKSSFVSSPTNGLIINDPFHSITNGSRNHDSSRYDCIQNEYYSFPMGAFSTGDKLSRKIDKTNYNFFGYKPELWSFYTTLNVTSTLEAYKKYGVIRGNWNTINGLFKAGVAENVNGSYSKYDLYMDIENSTIEPTYYCGGIYNGSNPQFDSIILDINLDNHESQKSQYYIPKDESKNSPLHLYYDYTNKQYVSLSAFSGVVMNSLLDDVEFYNIHISKDYDACLKYLDDGTVPKDAKIKYADDDGNEIEKDDPGKDEDDSKYDKQDEKNPTHGSISCGGNNYYLMQSEQLNNFISWFNNYTPSAEEIASNMFTNKYGNLLECVCGISYVPCAINKYYTNQGTETIKIGKLDTGISANIIKNEPSNFKLAEFKIERKFKNFLDYEPYTKYQLYLPYVGVIELPTNTIVSNKGTTVVVKAAIDISTLTLTYTIYSNGMVIYETSVSYGQSIPISLTDRIGTFSSAITETTNRAVGAVVAGATGNVMGVATNIASYHYKESPVVSTGTSTSSGGRFQPQKCYLIASYPVTKRPDTYGHNVGFPCMKSIKLNDKSLKGFTKCHNPVIEFGNSKRVDNSIVYPYESEIEELYNILKEGFYL